MGPREVRVIFESCLHASTFLITASSSPERCLCPSCVDAEVGEGQGPVRGGRDLRKGRKRARASRGGDRGARAAETPPRRETSPRGRSHAFDGIIERFDVDPRPARGGARSSRSLDRRAPCFFESPWANGGARARDPRLEAHLEHGLESIGHARHLAGVSTFVSDARSRGGGSGDRTDPSRVEVRQGDRSAAQL